MRTGESAAASRGNRQLMGKRLVMLAGGRGRLSLAAATAMRWPRTDGRGRAGAAGSAAGLGRGRDRGQEEDAGAARRARHRHADGERRDQEPDRQRDRRHPFRGRRQGQEGRPAASRSTRARSRRRSGRSKATSRATRRSSKAPSATCAATPSSSPRTRRRSPISTTPRPRPIRSAARCKADQAALENLKVQLSYCTIRAPISGRISQAAVKVGNFVRSADLVPIAMINQIAPVYVTFTVAAEEPARRAPGARVRDRECRGHRSGRDAARQRRRHHDREHRRLHDRHGDRARHHAEHRRAAVARHAGDRADDAAQRGCRGGAVRRRAGEPGRAFRVCRQGSQGASFSPSRWRAPSATSR